jgi:hypothetical protein
MAANMYKKYTESLTREWAVPAGTKSGWVVINAQSGQIGVALGDRGDGTRAANIPGVTGGTVPNGMAGVRPGGAVVAVDGSWLLTVTGVTAGDTGAGGAGTDEGTEVYGIVSAGVITSFTTTASGNTYIGVIDDGQIVGTVAPVKIGQVI